MTRLGETKSNFNDFTMLYLDHLGRFLDPDGDVGEEPRPVSADELPRFLRRKIRRPQGMTDVFVWVHGWQNDELRAIATARRLFSSLAAWFETEQARYPNLDKVVPGFVAVHWPSNSTPGPLGYRKIRKRAAEMTTRGEAEFFLASLLGYLDNSTQRGDDRKVLRSREGFYIHCLGHSFGGRFLSSAVKAAAMPTPRTRKVLGPHRETGFAFNVDSLCVLQMAAGHSAFGTEFLALLDKGPLVGPIVLTHTSSDNALCLWHRVAEGEAGIGCNGATEPADRISNVLMKPIADRYSTAELGSDLVNVNASNVFTEGGWTEGAHSDFFHEETLHLIASVVDQVHA